MTGPPLSAARYLGSRLHMPLFLVPTPAVTSLREAATHVLRAFQTTTNLNHSQSTISPEPPRYQSPPNEIKPPHTASTTSPMGSDLAV